MRISDMRANIAAAFTFITAPQSRDYYVELQRQCRAVVRQGGECALEDVELMNIRALLLLTRRVLNVDDSNVFMEAADVHTGALLCGAYTACILTWQINNQSVAAFQSYGDALRVFEEAEAKWAAQMSPTAGDRETARKLFEAAEDHLFALTT